MIFKYFLCLKVQQCPNRVQKCSKTKNFCFWLYEAIFESAYVEEQLEDAEYDIQVLKREWTTRIRSQQKVKNIFNKHCNDGNSIPVIAATDWSFMHSSILWKFLFCDCHCPLLFLSILNINMTNRIKVEKYLC